MEENLLFNHSDGKDLLVDCNDPVFKTLVKRDLYQTVRESQLSIEHSLYEPLLIQSVQGHAQNGHKEFKGMKFPNVTLSNLVKAADLDLKKIKEKRQEVLDHYADWLESVKKEKTDRLIFNGRPLFGFLPFNNAGLTIIPEYVIKGTILCGLMDSYEWRMKTLEEFAQTTIDGGLLTIGCGESYLMDIRALAGLGVGINDLSRNEISDKTIEYYRKEGAIVAPDNPNAETVYIRRRIGAGTSDDCSFILAGTKYKQFGLSAAESALWAGFCIDGSDTIDKLLARPKEGGYDEWIAKNLKEEFPDAVSDKEITAFIYYVSKSNGLPLVSSSHKRLVQKVSHILPIEPTILHHRNYLISSMIPKKSFNVGFDRMPSTVFYPAVQQRLDHFSKEN